MVFKKFIYLLFGGFLLLNLSGCGNSEPSAVISFDEYRIALHTTNIFTEESDSSRISSTVQKYLLALYTAGEKNGFDDSIMILKMPNIYENTTDFVIKNTEDISRPNYDEDGKKETRLSDCETDIPLIVKKSLIDDETRPIYFVQAFFLSGDNAYLVSAGTDDEDSYDELYRDFKNIACISQKSSKK